MKKSFIFCTLAVLFFLFIGCENSNEPSRDALEYTINELEHEIYELEEQIHWLTLENEHLNTDINFFRSDAVEKEQITEECRSFYSGIISLVYDHKYDVVETLLHYCPEGVEAALEQEFGVADLKAIVEYLETEYSVEISAQSHGEARIEKPRD